jgi:hypothetical protein
MEPVPFLRARGSRAISRILCRPSLAERSRWSFLWDPDCSGPQAAYPRATTGPVVEKQHRCPASHALLFGLAPGDACRPAVSPRPRWALTPPFQPCLIPFGPSAVCFLLRRCRITPPGHYPAPCPRSPDFPLASEASDHPPSSHAHGDYNTFPLHTRRYVIVDDRSRRGWQYWKYGAIKSI